MISRITGLALLGSLTASIAITDPGPAPLLGQEAFDLSEPAEVIATLTASCQSCDWGRQNHEASLLRLEVDGRYSQHLFLSRGAREVPYPVLLGSFPAGRHVLTVRLASEGSAKGAGKATVSHIGFQPITAGAPEHEAVALAPILYARPNTVGRFTDVPLLMWYEKDKTDRGVRVRYSVIFSNEDGGTPADRLLATWGRLTDIEYIYGIEFDATGAVIEETFQGKDHQIVPFEGRREGRHPLLYVVTDNNMVGEDGITQQRYGLVPIPFDLTHSSREEVMDAYPWTYALTAKEARREGRVSAAPAPGSKMIVDPSRYAVLEACADPADAAYATFAFAVGVERGGHMHYYDSTAGVPEYRIARGADNFPNGCFRGAVALPKGVKPSEVKALQVRAFPRPPRKGETAPPPGAGPAHLRRVNKLFMMTTEDLPRPSLFSWEGNDPLALSGDSVTLEIKAPTTGAKTPAR